MDRTAERTRTLTACRPLLFGDEMKRNIKDRLVAYIKELSWTGPCFGYELESVARTRFGCSPTTLTARLRELVQDGKLVRMMRPAHGRNRQFVCYVPSERKQPRHSLPSCPNPPVRTDGGLPAGAASSLTESQAAEQKNARNATSGSKRRGSQATQAIRDDFSKDCEQMALGDALRPKEHQQR